ncbi:MAG: hypothetical protein LAP85_27435 [Acidobacteriia bacterium]|nr:hypothetical protein [Terriglobia bacterium]
MKSVTTLSKCFWLLALAGILALPLPAQEAVQKPVQDPELVIPAGTVLPVTLNTYLNTKNTQVGDVFYADTAYPIWIQQRLVIPRGSIVRGTVTEVYKPGKIKGKGKIAVRFDSVLLPNGVERSLVAAFHGIHGPGAEKIDRNTESVEQGGTSNKGADVGTVVGTAGEGAIIGGLASRDASSIGIGAGAGAAAGLAIVLLSRDRDLVLQPGTQLDLELRQPMRFAYGEVIFSQAELNSATRTPAVRPTPPQKRTTPSRRGWFPIPWIWR